MTGLHGAVLLGLAKVALAERMGVPVPAQPNPESGVAVAESKPDSSSDTGRRVRQVQPDRPSTSAIIAAHPWLAKHGASFVTLTEHGRLRGCIGTLEAYRPLGEDVAAHAVDAALHDPRFRPVTAAEIPLLRFEVSVLSEPEPIVIVGADGRYHPVGSRAELERALRPGTDGLIVADRTGRHRATFLPQVWEELPRPHDFVSHLLAKAGLPPATDWDHGELDCSRYTVTAFAEREQ